MTSAIAPRPRGGAGLVLISSLVCVAFLLGCEQNGQSAKDGGAPNTSRATAQTAPESAGNIFSSGPAAPATDSGSVAPTADHRETTAPAAAAAVPAGRTIHRRIAYYFHRTLRCPTCLAIERQAREAIEAFYGGELASGALEWHAINIEEPQYAHFEKDFELTSQSLVLVEMNGERVARWKLLPKVWELVDDPYAFQDYVAREVGLFLSGDETEAGE